MHTVIRWINSEPEAQREYGNYLVQMMLEAGSDSRAKNKGGLTPYQLVDPGNEGLRVLIEKHQYATLNQGDFINVEDSSAGRIGGGGGNGMYVRQEAYGDEDAEFSGSDEEERVEWERRKRALRGKKG